ncbi:MAG TPA: SIMPL domain-containing protein, partial [Adhaeribacter sp.]|nr:SIMPL domain-containing protein [Adhaeribacter sp.]
ARSVAASNSQINKRISNFIRNLKKSGIKEADIYTDIITQHRVYDLEQKDRGYFEEILKGFMLSKNVIVKYRKPAQVEEMMLHAAQDSIFDLVKVDYMVEDVGKVYDELYAAASEVIKKKRALYLNLTGASLKPNSQIYAEDFATFYPANMYKNYTAAGTNYFESYDWMGARVVKKVHKPQTFYFDKPDYSGFDKIINPAVLEPQIAFTLTLQVKYQLAKQQ